MVRTPLSKAYFGEKFRSRPKSIQAEFILDPELALHTPDWLWLNMGMRAVDHAVEAMCSTACNPYDAGLAQSGLRMLADSAYSAFF